MSPDGERDAAKHHTQATSAHRKYPSRYLIERNEARSLENMVTTLRIAINPGVRFRALDDDTLSSCDERGPTIFLNSP